MPVGQIEIPGSFVDPACPVDWDHPLNRGLVGFWKIVPNSGWRIRNLVRPANGGTIVGGTWKGPSGQKTAWGSLQFTGTGHHVDVGNVDNTIGTASKSLTVAIAFRHTGIPGFANLLDKGSGTNSRPFQLFVSSTLNSIRIQQYDGSTNPTADTTGIFNDGKWHLAVGVRDCRNSLMKIYIDGVDKTASSSNVGFSTNFNDTSSIRLVSLRNGQTDEYVGFVDNAMVWNGVAFSTAQVARLWQEYCRGFPETLRWVRPHGRKIFIPGSAALTGTATETIDEADIVAGGKTIILTLDGDTFVPAATTNIQFVGGASAGKLGATSGTTTIALDGGLTGGIASSVAAGDLVIAAFATGSAADRTLAITDGTNGYTLIGSEQYANDTEDTNLRIAYKFMGVTPDAATTFGPTGNNADSGAMAVYVFRGVDPTTPLDVTVTQDAGTDTSRANPPAITPTTAGAFVVCVGAGAHDGGEDTFTSGDLTGFLTQAGADDTNDITLGIGHHAWTSSEFNAAAFGHSQADSVNYSWAATTIALRPAVATPFDDAISDIIDGLDSAQSESGGWDAKVKAELLANPSSVVRTSDTVCTITLPAVGDYNITAQETITATIPATALAGGSPIVATPTFTVDEVVGGEFTKVAGKPFRLAGMGGGLAA